MSASDPGDGSPSPEPDFEQDYSNMSEEKLNRASSEDKSPDRTGNDSKPAAKANPKDPSRPRRKKARRACFACQRAHLTCGDERPCIRCIKRGLQDQCHDGVRKKAKYLHDAPPEALMPGYQGTYNVNGSHSMSAAPGAPLPTTNMPVSQSGNYFRTPTSAFTQYGPMDQSAQMGRQTVDGSNVTGQANMSSPPQYHQPPDQQISPVNEVSTDFRQAPLMPNMGNTSFEASLFDANDPSLLNFSNLSEYNFGNHYGALEFGMLGHMTSGAVNTPELEMLDAMGQSGSMSYDGTAAFPTSNFPYSGGFQGWQTVGSQRGSTTNLWALQHNGMDAFAVADTTASLTGASPHSQNQDWSAGYQSSKVSPETPFAQPDQNKHVDPHSQRHRRPTAFPVDLGPMTPMKRRKDTKQIYASVTMPYPYTHRFHVLTNFLQRHYPSDKRLSIAKALATIRPTFIALARDLNDDDLIFAEQSFQRALAEYEDRWQSVGTPSIICRRTGEIVSCNKEFSLVTGWRKDVLLGKEPNLNVNFGSSSGTHTGSSTRGQATPRVPNAEAETSLPQPVFIIEVMDQDSSVQFFERFAELGFSASSSSMPAAHCSLIKYKTKEDPGWGPEDRLAKDRARNVKQGGIKSEYGTNVLGEQDGKIDMCMTWMVRQDIFDMPMMTVINFLPCI